VLIARPGGEKVCRGDIRTGGRNRNLAAHMSHPRLEWKVGLFVFIGLALLAGLLLEFSKGLSLFRPTYQIYLRAENIGGLKPRADVLMSGVQVGTVSAIQLAPDGKSVTIT